MNYIILVVLIIVGVYDIYLSVKGRPTISQRYQKLFPTWLDMIIFGLGIFGLCLWKRFVPELDFALAVVMAGFWGHITFPNSETYKK